jgi:hypothetical protein
MNMKSILSIFKILFLSALLMANVVGFHYYFTPVAKDNLNYIPSTGKMVFTINLKSISGKLFEEAVFRPENFEKDIISIDEKSLVLKNSTYGINPFGLVSFFIFPYQNQMISGASLNLQNSNEFIDEMEKSKYENQTVDGVLVFKSEKNTFFVFEHAVVILFETFSSSVNETLAVEVLQNEKLANEWNGKNDFQLYTASGLLSNLVFDEYFRLLPEFAKSIVINGNFELGNININGNIELDKILKLIDSDKFETNKKVLPTKQSLSFGLFGKNFGPIFNPYLNSVLDPSKDTTNTIEKLISESYESVSFSMDRIGLDVDFLRLGADLFSGKWFNPTYEVDLNLSSKVNSTSLDVTNFLKVNSKKDRKVRLNIGQLENNLNLGYFYFNPSRFLDNSDMNMFIKGAIDPFVIFEEIFFLINEIKENKAFFNGQVSFKDKGVHTLIQLRLLFKNLSSMI